MNVHFILTGGYLGPCEQRAIFSAKVHGETIVLWYTGDKPAVHGLDVSLERIEIPVSMSGVRPARIYDVLRWQIAHDHGGLILGLDTISLRPAWDLLTTQEIVLSRDWPMNDPEVLVTEEKLQFPYNDPILAKQGCDLALQLRDEVERRVKEWPENWGLTGPYMLSKFVSNYPGRIEGVAFPALCGFAPGYTWRFFLGLASPGPDVRVIHLFSECYRALNERRYQDWAHDNPYYAGEVARRTDNNERLLRCP